MSDRNEQRQNDYLELIQALLECPQDEEDRLLAGHPSLMDEGLVMELLNVAEMLVKRNDPEAASTIEWLVNFAEHLAQKLGLDLESGKVDSEEYVKFSLELLQVVAMNNGDRQIVDQFFNEHCTYLNEHLLFTLPRVVEMILVKEEDPDRKFFIASTLGNLAMCLYGFRKGNRSLNLELSITCYDRALVECAREKFSIEWAKTQTNRANVYSDRIKGEKAENIELAIAGYNAALEVRTREKLPIQWAATQMNLAGAYWDRIKGEKAENIELAIAGYNAALEVYTRRQFPFEWATTHMNLAVAYSDRIKGEKGENIELAISGCNAALEVYTRRQFPFEWATTHMNLAVAYSDRIKGEKGENIELAIGGCNTALEVYTRAQFPFDWAKTQMILAVAYKNRIEGEEGENIELAIAGYEAALEVHTRDKFPFDWAMTQLNRANAYQNRIEGEKGENIELAIAGYKAALEVYTRNEFPIEWAMTTENLAILHTGENDELAINLYHQVLEVFTPANLPINALTASRGLANIYFKQGVWQSAMTAYETAMQSVETSRSWIINEDSRQQLLKDALSVYENAIQCAINLGNYPQSIQYTERIRSRQLVDLMGTKDLYPDAEIPADIQQYLNEYEQLNRQIQHLREHGSPDSDGTTNSTRTARSLSRDNTTIQALEAQKRAQYLKIRAFDPAIAGQIAVEPIDFAAIQKLITTPHTAILTCYTTDDDTHIFIIKQGQQPTLHTCTSQGWSELQRWLQTEWVNPYHNDNSIWQQNLPTLLTEISHRLQLDTLIEQHLTDITELIIVPHLNLHQIPFAALPINPTQTEASKNPIPEGTSDQNPLLGGVPEGRGVLLGDKFIIRSIPSCQILHYCQQRKPITTKHIGTVEDAEDNLLGARYEGEQIAALYNIPTANRLRGSTQATVANYRELLTRVNRLHSSHHAISRPDNPIESALILANGERITLGDLLLGKRYRDTLDEVFLSACETHVGTATLTDDVATLTTGFLCIGARSVQSTLWSVDDLVTALFDIFYHQERRDDRSRAFSLRAAQFRLRNFSGSEFKLRFYDELIEHFNKNSPAMITDLKQQCKKLNAQQSTLNNDTEEWQKLAETMKNLIRKIKSIESIPAVLNGYCATDRPFAKPYYWAAFITQGMA